MRQRLSVLVLVVLAVAGLVFMADYHAAHGGRFANGEFSSLAYRVALIVFIAGSALTLLRKRFVQAISAALLWGAVALVLLIGYSYRFELHDVADRVVAELVPGHVISRGQTVAVARTLDGDFTIAARVNGAPVAMVLDTGATSVVLTRHDAKAAGLPIDVLNYTVYIDTANGRTRAAPVRLDRVAVGSLVERSVDALVAQPGELKTSLLGMSFLNRLQSWQVSGDRLILHGYP